MTSKLKSLLFKSDTSSLEYELQLWQVTATNRYKNYINIYKKKAETSLKKIYLNVI